MPDVGLFGPDSLTWRVNREQALLLGGGRALLLQLAHPLVAAGVADHSDFRSDPLRRLRRTLDATLAMIFGTTAEAEAAAAGVRAVHERVTGTLRTRVGRFDAGTPYRAEDPALLADYLDAAAVSFVEWPEAAAGELGDRATVEVILRHAGGDRREVEVR